MKRMMGFFALGAFAVSAMSLALSGCGCEDDDDDEPGPGTLSVQSATYTVAEDGGTVTITVTRTGGSKGAASVDYATADGTAAAPGDYTAITTTTLNWADGVSTAQTFDVTIIDDGDVEGDEAFDVVLSNVVVAALGTATATVTITDDETPGTLALESATYSVAEDGGTVTITVTRTGGSDGAVSVDYATADGTAAAPGDYTAITATTLNWADGVSTAQTFDVTIIDDGDAEGDETFDVVLSNVVVAALGTATATVTITDDDTTITVTAPDGGESWVIGSQKDITWTTTGPVGNVDIAYTTDGGGNWTSIFTGVDSALGTYAWTIPDDESATVRVRVQEADGNPTDMSDADFAIAVPGSMSGTITYAGIQTGTFTVAAIVYDSGENVGSTFEVVSDSDLAAGVAYSITNLPPGTGLTVLAFWDTDGTPGPTAGDPVEISSVDITSGANTTHNITLVDP